MTLDVKALRAAATAAERAYAKRGATYSMWRTAATAARTLHDLCTPATVLALLDRLERAERVEARAREVLAAEPSERYFPLRALRAALDDEAPR